MTTPTEANIRLVADTFKKCVQERLSPVDLVEIDAINRHHNDSSCATHDYFDANCAMIDAFERLNMDIGLGREEGMPQETADLINAAWDLAKHEGFALPFPPEKRKTLNDQTEQSAI